MDTIQIRIDEKTKKSAKKILENMGLDMSGAIKIFLKQVVIKKGLPFQVITENGFTLEFEMETLKAIQEAKKGIGLIGPFEGNEAVEYLRNIVNENKKLQARIHKKS